jgi:hypothetical protein
MAAGNEEVHINSLFSICGVLVVSSKSLGTKLARTAGVLIPFVLAVGIEIEVLMC